MSAKEKLTLKAISQEIHHLGYRIIYEKGNFQSGHCIVHNKKVIVVNKFLADKIKIIILKELIKSISDEVHPLSANVKSEEE